jgi:hypothetical protein
VWQERQTQPWHHPTAVSTSACGPVLRHLEESVLILQKKAVHLIAAARWTRESTLCREQGQQAHGNLELQNLHEVACRIAVSLGFDARCTGGYEHSLELRIFARASLSYHLHDLDISMVFERETEAFTVQHYLARPDSIMTHDGRPPYFFTQAAKT